ncbi:hypothetical protein [Variovorax sp. RHLX14]|uniref:hypothetical protein n=1 Tax=Variovorax sp. RHLX14 TaxID=1259731 RepID=UPI003F494766
MIRSLAQSPPLSLATVSASVPARMRHKAGHDSVFSDSEKIADAVVKFDQENSDVGNERLAGRLVVAGDYFKLGGLLHRKLIDPNTKSINKSNSLLHAAFGFVDNHFNQQLVVYELVSSGADVDAKNIYGMTPLDVAVGRTNPNRVAIGHLLRFGAQVTLAAHQRALGLAREGDRRLLHTFRNLKARQANPPVDASHFFGSFF